MADCPERHPATALPCVHPAGHEPGRPHQAERHHEGGTHPRTDVWQWRTAPPPPSPYPVGPAPDLEDA